MAADKEVALCEFLEGKEFVVYREYMEIKKRHLKHSGRLYFAAVRSKPRNTSAIHYFNVDDEFQYEK